MKEYLRRMNLHDSRVLFRYDFKLLQSIQMNQKSNKRYRENSYRCIDCLSVSPPVSHPDSQEALVSEVCQGNSDLRAGRRLSQPKELAMFLRAVISRRNERKSE